MAVVPSRDLGFTAQPVVIATERFCAHSVDNPVNNCGYLIGRSDFPRANTVARRNRFLLDLKQNQKQVVIKRGLIQMSLHSPIKVHRNITRRRKEEHVQGQESHVNET
jgi:hypothetical protein